MSSIRRSYLETSNRDFFVKAVNNRQEVRFTYKLMSRTIWPTKVGVLNNGEWAVEGMKIGGWSISKGRSPWRLYLLKEIMSPTHTGIQFKAEQLHRDYDQVDGRFSEIWTLV